MEDIKINLTKDLSNMNEAPPLESKNICYNCSECQSEIEIIKIDEELIEFKCNNNHNIKMNIKDYLDKLKEYKDKKILNDEMISNNSKCNKHKEDYLSYCFECNKHLCKKCLKAGEHGYHYKINIIEVIPKYKILTKIENLIINNNKKMEDLIKNKKDIEDKLNNILNENMNKIKEIKIKNKRKNNKAKKKELKFYNDKYESKLEELHKEYNKKIKDIKIEYNNKIKDIKIKYSNNINEINNKYKIINDKNENIYNNKINKSKNEMKIIIDNYGYNEKINKITNFNELIEIIYIYSIIIIIIIIDICFINYFY